MITIWRDGHWEVRNLIYNHCINCVAYLLFLLVTFYSYKNIRPDFIFKEDGLILYYTALLCIGVYLAIKLLQNFYIILILLYLYQHAYIHTTFVHYIGGYEYKGPLSTNVYVNCDYIKVPKVEQVCLIINCNSRYFVYPMG